MLVRLDPDERAVELQALDDLPARSAISSPANGPASAFIVPSRFITLTTAGCAAG